MSSSAAPSGSAHTLADAGVSARVVPDYLDVRTPSERELDAAYASVQVAYAHARTTVFDQHPAGHLDENDLTLGERSALTRFHEAEVLLDDLRKLSHRRVTADFHAVTAAGGSPSPAR